MTSFFEHQDNARRNTRVLVWLMGLAVVAMALSIYALALLVEHVSLSRMLVGTAQPLFQPQLFLAAFLGTAAVVAVASGSRMLSLRGGGASIAEMLGGRLISGQPRDSLEKRLLNVVEEMAIASGVPVPQVFVLDQEAGINAFAAGLSLDDAAVSVTRGCLEKLTREELQGVIAHEFSHVLNGDMRLNVRLMGVVFGIVCIGLFGRFLMRMAAQSRDTFSSRRREGSSVPAIFLFGLGVFVVGSLGELFGKLIKAAVSRQREFLADASAVQFTRNPQGIAGALKKIGGLPEGAKLGAAHADEASHFFFGDIRTRLFAHSILATHPPLRERIERIDPSFRGEFPEVGPGIVQPEELVLDATAAVSGFGAASDRSAGAPVQAGSCSLLAGSIVGQVGTASIKGLDRSRQLLDGLSPALRRAAHNPFSACALVYALLLSEDATVAAQQRAQLDALAGSSLHGETLRLLAAVQALSRRDRLPLLFLLAPSLRAMSPEQRAIFSRTVQALIDADAAVSIFEYVVAETLRTRLCAAHDARARSRVRHRSLKAVSLQLELLLSLLAHAGDFDGQGAQAAFAAGAARLSGVSIHLLSPSDKLLSGLGAALEELAGLLPQLSALVVDACAHTVLADERVSEDEETLLRAVCDALGSPLPALGG
ncbi:MAG TPA: M48 family metallopeptidase [Polyangiales bacterium]